MPYRCFGVLLCLALASACGQTADEATPAGEAAATAPAGGLIAGTPDGDLDQWVADIREGIATLPELARTDGPGASRKALELYITRQEYIEMYYGAGGRLNASAALDAKIEAAEARFHELMQLLNKQPIDLAAVAPAVEALDKAQAEVLAAWKKEGKRLDRSAAAAAPVANSTSSN